MSTEDLPRSHEPQAHEPQAHEPQSLDEWIAHLELKPLSARSIVLSVLLGNHPPEARASHLVGFAQAFGVEEGTLRTALSRMVANGEVEVEQARYTLTGRLLERQRQQDAGLHSATEPWDGSWWTVIVVAERRSVGERRAFRSAMDGARMGELRPDLWMRPTNIDIDVGDLGDEVLVTRGPMIGRSEVDAIELAGRLWDLPSIEAKASRLLEAADHARLTLDRDGVEAVPVAFAISAAIVQFLRVEPQLPEQLSPAPKGTGLRIQYEELNRLFKQHMAELLANQREN